MQILEKLSPGFVSVTRKVMSEVRFMRVEFVGYAMMVRLVMCHGRFSPESSAAVIGWAIEKWACVRKRITFMRRERNMMACVDG